MIRRLIFITLAAALLIGLWLSLAPDAAQKPANASAEPVQMAATQVAEPLIYAWQISAKQVLGPQRIRAQQGDTITLSLLSETDDEVHLHGYERVVRLRANEPATLAITLTHSGRFELESHQSHRVISDITVAPR